MQNCAKQICAYVQNFVSMIGHIYINGQIGNSYNDDGSVAVKGIELQDVVTQAEANKGAEVLNVHITSKGGSIRVGKLIAEYISKLPNAITIAEKECASMGTEIHLAVPLANRKIQKGTEYFVHSPLMQGVSGNADELNDMADYIREAEKEMLSMYCKATGLDKAAMSGLMKQETSLTDEQCISLKFASEILPITELKAVAFLDKPKTNKSFEQMEKSLSKKMETMFSNLVAKLKGEKEPEVKAMDIETDKGQLSIEGELVEGSVCMLDGAIAPEGDYTQTDGTVITVGAEGKITAVKAVEAEATIEEVKAELEKVKTENATMKAEFETKLNDEVKKLETEIVAFKKTVKSNYTPPAAAAAFRKPAGAGSPEKTTAELRAERKALYKKK